MNNRFDKFIGEHLPLDGIVACGVRLPDHTQVCRCFTEDLSTAQMELAVNRVTLAADSLNHHRLEADRFCWTFENVRIQLALRTDGSALIVLCKCDAKLSEDAATNRLLEDFSQLQAE